MTDLSNHFGRCQDGPVKESLCKIYPYSFYQWSRCIQISFSGKVNGGWWIRYIRGRCKHRDRCDREKGQKSRCKKSRTRTIGRITLKSVRRFPTPGRIWHKQVWWHHFPLGGNLFNRPKLSSTPNFSGYWRIWLPCLWKIILILIFQPWKTFNDLLSALMSTPSYFVNCFDFLYNAWNFHDVQIAGTFLKKDIFKDKSSYNRNGEY